MSEKKIKSKVMSRSSAITLGVIHFILVTSLIATTHTRSYIVKAVKDIRLAKYDAQFKIDHVFTLFKPISGVSGYE